MPLEEISPAVEAPVESQIQMPTDDSGGMSFEEAMTAALESQAEDSGLPEVPEGLTEPPKEAVVPPAEAAPPVEPTDITEPPAAPEDAPAADKSLARIMERETQLMERQAKLDAAQPELEALRTRVQAFESAQNTFQQNPLSYIQSLAPDMDLKQLATTLWYESQGAQAPQAYLEKKVANQHNTELAGRIAKIEQGEQERQRQSQTNAAQQAVAQYQGSLEAFARTAPAESFPLLSAMQAKNPQWVGGTMLEIAQQHARNTRGQVLTPDQAAASLEKHIASFQVGQQPQPQVTPPVTTQGTSLRNNSTQTQPDREPEDELSDEVLRRKAFEACGRPDLA